MAGYRCQSRLYSRVTPKSELKEATRASQWRSQTSSESRSAKVGFQPLSSLLVSASPTRLQDSTSDAGLPPPLSPPSSAPQSLSPLPLANSLPPLVSAQDDGPSQQLGSTRRSYHHRPYRCSSYHPRRTRAAHQIGPQEDGKRGRFGGKEGPQEGSRSCPSSQGWRGQEEGEEGRRRR